MIATLTGTVAEKLSETVILDVQGIGYGLLTPLEDYGKLAAGSKAKFYIYEHIRENAHDLYGFTQIDTKRLFEQLLEVNGVGPKMALSILGIGSVEDVRRAISASDAKFVQAAPGVGKRVAERVVVDLKDKVAPNGTAELSSWASGGAALQDEAIQALVSLGYSVQDAASTLATIDTSLDTEERVRLALKVKDDNGN